MSSPYILKHKKTDHFKTRFVLHESIIGLEESELMSQDIMAASAEIF